MIAGNPDVFAVESQIVCAYERTSFRGIGFFLIHIKSTEYGVRASDATLLANSFDSVEERIRSRGRHLAFFANEPDAGRIADSVQHSIYAPDQEYSSVLGVSRTELCNVLHSNGLVWAPDGDQAFDDGSHVVHFDVGDRVRLIGFKCGEGYRHNPGSLSDIWMTADTFYLILERWRDAFEAEWIAAPKMQEP